MLLVFGWFFSAPVISWIESIGGGQVGVGGGGGWGAIGGLSTHSDSKSSAVPSQYGTQTNTIHKGGQDCHQEQFCTPCNPIKVLKGHEMHPSGLIASVKSHL